MSIILRHRAVVRAEIFTALRCFVTASPGIAQHQSHQRHQPLYNYCGSCRSHPSASLHNHQPVRCKSKKAGKQSRAAANDDDDLDDEQDDQRDEYDELLEDKHNRTVRVTVNSMRADLLLKAGLGIARNKVDALFYDSKIRVNGRKLLKKSAQLAVEDEIDVVRGTSPTNPDHLVVSRVEIISVTPRTENLSVTLRRHKSLIVESYKEHGAYEEGQNK
uniref:S4 RNA-binding domain-containing protein n=1 Tax=Anopheles farauti TaxID=69004 RepID=A0A182Q127_9DIPT